MGTLWDARRRRLYVSTGRAGAVVLVDPEAGRVLKTIAVGKRPWGMGISPDARRLFVANGPSDDVSVIDLDEDKEVQRIKAGSGPWGIAIVPVAR
jgi:YVTN family beta-propeller protein